MLDSRQMTLQRLASLGIIIAILTTGAVIISLYAGFQQLILHPIAMFGAILLASLMGIIMLKVALVPSQRYTGWVRGIIGPNGRWFFLVLLLVWGAGMAFLASLGLGPQQEGAPALVGLFIGIFLFMGFIWSVIGE